MRARLECVMEDKKIPFTEDGRADLDATLLMLHLLR